MKSAFASLLAVVLLSTAATAGTVFDDLRNAAPRSDGVFGGLQNSAPRSPFEQIIGTAPKSIFDQIRETSPVRKPDSEDVMIVGE